MTSTFYSPGTVVTSPWLNDVDISTYATLTSVTGINAITATGPSSLLTYTLGQRFFFMPAANNTGAVTININGLGNKAITKLGAISLVAQDLLIGTMAEIVYDGTRFQLLDPQTVNLTQIIPVTNGGTGATTASQALINLGATGRLIGVQVITAIGAGTYTPTAGTTSIIVELVGGGGSGGGCPATGAGQASFGSGGGGGGYVQSRFTSGFSGASYSVGAGGVGALGVSGNAGGNTTFAALTAGGGGGGQTALVTPPAVIGGGSAGSASGGLLNIAGAQADVSLAISTGFGMGGGGAGSYFSASGGGGSGGGGNGNGALNGAYGTGGGGTFNGQSIGTARTSGPGAPGIIVIYEYA